MTSRLRFKNRIRKYRQRLGLTQLQLAVLVKVSVNSISAFETGAFHPSAYHAALLCEALQCSFEELFYFIPET